MNRAISVNELYNKKRKVLQFDGDFAASFGHPEAKGTWLVWGPSYNGKTTFMCQLCKYLTRFGRVAYNSMEEGDSKTMASAFRRVGMEQVKNRIMLLDNEPLADLRERLKRQKAPTFVVIDSIQYADITHKEYKLLKKEYPKVVWIIVSHEKGKLPTGKLAEKIRYDANIKIRVVGYKAFVSSRYTEGTSVPYTIWREGADKYHGVEF